MKLLKKLRIEENLKNTIEAIEIWNDVDKRYEKLKCPKSKIITSREEALQILKDIYLELPLIIRPSLTLGGSGGGIAKDLDSSLPLVEALYMRVRFIKFR